jgi:hypothetical protein
VPAPAGQTYFNAAPEETSTKRPVALAIGESATIDITAFSDGPMNDWDLSAVDFGLFETGRAHLKFAFDKTKVHNGSKVKLTVTLDRDPGAQRAAAFAIVSKSGKVTHFWPAVVLKK